MKSRLQNCAIYAVFALSYYVLVLYFCGISLYLIQANAAGIKAIIVEPGQVMSLFFIIMGVCFGITYFLAKIFTKCVAEKLG